MERLRKELIEIESEFNELKCNEVQLDHLAAEARATISQYDIESQTLEENYQKYTNHMEGIIGVLFAEVDFDVAAEVYMACKCDELQTKLHELKEDMRQLLEQPPQPPPQ